LMESTCQWNFSVDYLYKVIIQLDLLVDNNKRFGR
jgi:hypothetical protein